MQQLPGAVFEEDVLSGRAVCGYCGAVTVAQEDSISKGNTPPPGPARDTAPAAFHAEASIGRIVKHVIAEFRREQGVDLSGDENAMKRIIGAAGKALVGLRREGFAEVNLPFITADASGPRHLCVRLKKP